MSGFDPADFEEADFDEEAAAALDELDDEGWSDDETTARGRETVAAKANAAAKAHKGVWQTKAARGRAAAAAKANAEAAAARQTGNAAVSASAAGSSTAGPIAPPQPRHDVGPVSVEVLTCIDSLSLIFAQLVDVCALQSVGAVNKQWNRVVKRIKGWRVLQYQQSWQPPCMLEMRPIPPFTGGPTFLVALPPETQSAAAFSHTILPGAGFAFGLTLSMSVFSVTTGQTTTTTILHDVHYHSRWDALDVYCDMATGAEHFELLVLARQKLHVFKLRVDAAGELCNHEGVVGAMLDSDQMVTLAQPPDEDLTVFFSANANFIFVCNTSRVRTLNRHNPGEGALEPSITWEPSEMPALMNPQSGRRVPEGELAEMSCDHEVIAVADIGHHCIFLLDILPGIEGRLALQRTFTGGGHLVSPFAVALSARYLYVLDTAEAADRVVVLDRHTDAVLHVMRFGPCGVSNLRCIAASGPTVIIGDAHMRKCIVMKEAHAARGATSDDCINGSHPESFGLRGHGHGVLAFLESALSHDDGQSPSDWDGPPPDELPVPEESQVLLMELYVHIPSFRDRLWFSLLHLLCENPRMRTFLTIPPRIHDAFWAHERFNLMPYLSGIMDDRRRWQQTTLDKWRKSAPALANKAKGTVSEARWKMSTSLIAKADAVSRFCGVEGSLSDRIEKSLMLCGVRERAAKMNLTQAILLLYHLIYDDESGSLNEVPPIMPAPGFVLLP